MHSDTCSHWHSLINTEGQQNKAVGMVGKQVIFFYPPTSVTATARFFSLAWDCQLGPEEREIMGSGGMDGEGAGQEVERRKDSTK